MTTADRRTAVIIEDDPDMRAVIAEVFVGAGFEAVPVADGEEGVRAVVERDPDAITIDISIPGIDGFEAARRIRAASDAYMFIISGRADEVDAVLGLSAGADDYIAKPFRPRELRARIDALARRLERQEKAAPNAVAAPVELLAHRDVTLDADSRMVSLGTDDPGLTRSEFDLLAALLRTRRRVRSKAELARMLRGDPTEDTYVSDADERAVEAHITNLRRKLGDSSAAPRYIETVRGVGYRLTEADGDASAAAAG
ncbi:MAG: DNA-binding response regulator [Microbacterium sp.]|uniref:response regulator transcription factor n=2 Tax=Microbacteriaceae TaxID=85023 RepID=UPI0008D977CC|nr:MULTISPECIES: response regulator transcription factor [Microbacterium]MAY51326.1 DNA-binding response regulator [Microbacterium sp.]|tara:strand:- start:1190 stop:1957 length:768 start_codon:yes stop_codon:yes gene_type:complete